jgi:transposase
MWTEITRPKYRRDGLPYASDTTDAEWAVLAPLMPAPHKGRGRPRTTKLRAVVNAIFYIAQSGCQWRMLPKDFPPFTTVQHYFYPWRNDGLWRQINHLLLMLAREAEGRDQPGFGGDRRHPAEKGAGGAVRRRGSAPSRSPKRYASSRGMAEKRTILPSKPPRLNACSSSMQAKARQINQRRSARTQMGQIGDPQRRCF